VNGGAIEMTKAKRKSDDGENFVTAEQFMAMSDDRLGRKAQLIAGEVVLMSPPSEVHARIVSNLSGLIRDQLRAKGSDCVPLTDVGVNPGPDRQHNVRVPDLLLTCGPSKPGRYFVEAPILICEVLSPRNARRTRDSLWAYALIPSVAEIVLLDSRRATMVIFRRNALGHWTDEPQSLIGKDSVFLLSSINLNARLADVYDGTSLI
jgi:Uma2 family endonuclease